MPPRPCQLAAVLLAVLSAPAGAATSVTLPAWTCSQPDTIYRDTFDTIQAAVPHDPSAGQGGVYPGKLTRTVHVAGLGSGTQNYYVYVPDNYDPDRPWPLLLALHGVAAVGDSEAMRTRDNWSGVAESGGFIIAAPVADEIAQCWDGQQYVPCESWLLPPRNGPSDYDLFAAIRADLEGAYNIERTRIYGWGFSAGGHVMHDLGVSQHSSAFNASTMAAYGVSSGILAMVACAGYSDDGCDALLNALPRKIPLDIHIGNNDPNYQAAKADHLRFVADGWINHETIFYSVFVGGHDYTVQQLGQVWTNLCPNAVTP